MALGRALKRLGVLLVSLAAAAGTGELGLRLLCSPPDPLDFQRRNDPAAWDSDGLSRLSVAFDPRLFWRRTPSRETTFDAPGARRLLVLADGSACDPRHGPPWPERLERLIDLNEGARPIAIMDAAEPGYSTFQGRRRLEGIAGRPELVVLGLGANDTHRVRLPDADYAGRLEGLGSLARSWLVLRAAHRLWAFQAGRVAAPRVAVEDTRANLAAIAARVRGWGGEVVLVDHPTTAHSTERLPTALDQLAPGVPRIRADPEAPGSVAIAAAVFAFLTERGLLLTRHRHAAEADMGVPDGWPELGQGFGPMEVGPRGLPGRWAEAEAWLTLERRSNEAGLAFEVTCPAPAEAEIEVNGVSIGGFGGCLGRRWYRFSLDPVPDASLRVRLATPRARQLFVHGVRLTPSGDSTEHASDPLYASELELQNVEDGRPELGPGWWSNEVWPDGRRGRWTSREASVYLERREAESGLLLEATLQSPADATSCRIEVNGVPVYAFTSANGRHRYGMDIERIRGRRLRVRLVVERTFDPGAEGDSRSLGLFVHSVRLARSPLP